MKILIYGSKGWIGSQFLNLIKDKEIFEETFEGISRLDNYHDVNNELNEIKPTHVISFIGRTHGVTHGVNYDTIDYLEQEGKLVENIRDNLFSPFVLAQLCNQKNIHYTYLGTGCIFKYDDNHPYEEEINGFTEEDQPNFFGSSYSIVKGYTDMMMHMYPNVLNLRIRMPIIGEKHPRNFITKITKYKKICSIKNSMTVLPELLPLVIKMMENNVVGTINLTNPGLISHNEILEMYKEIVDPNFEWDNFSQEEQRLILKADRSNNYMETKKLEELFPKVSNIKDAIRKCLINHL
jgi:nucleoside-diphosphate-sugar epimerase